MIITITNSNKQTMSSFQKQKNNSKNHNSKITIAPQSCFNRHSGGGFIRTLVFKGATEGKKLPPSSLIASHLMDGSAWRPLVSQRVCACVCVCVCVWLWVWVCVRVIPSQRGTYTIYLDVCVCLCVYLAISLMWLTLLIKVVCARLFTDNWNPYKE